jgi:cystathionine beta-lyase
LGADRRIDMETLDEAFRSATADGGAAAYLLCNPHNPTGTVHSGKELSEVAALANRYGIRVVADEIHAPLILSGASFTPYLSVPGSDDAFSVVSASKGWNLAGLKAAVAIAGPAAAADLDRMPEEVGHGPSHLGVIAHTAAFREARQWLDDLLVGLDANRRLLGSLLRQHLPMPTYSPPEATYMAWLDCRSLDASRPDAPSGRRGVVSDLEGPAAMFLDKARVALSSGHVFGRGGAGHVRLNFATSQNILTEAVTRMGSAVG